MFPPIPSEIILTFAGFATTNTDLSITGVIVCSTIGSIFGAIILYFIGRLLPRRKIAKFAQTKFGKMLRIKIRDINRVILLFNKNGIATVFFCRFVTVIRSLISIPAGITKMNFWVFVVFTAFGSLIWNTVLIYLGKTMGASWGIIVDYMGIYSKIILGVLTVILLVVIIIFHFKQKNKKIEGILF